MKNIVQLAGTVTMETCAIALLCVHHWVKGRYTLIEYLFDQL